MAVPMLAVGGWATGTAKRLLEKARGLGVLEAPCPPPPADVEGGAPCPPPVDTGGGALLAAPEGLGAGTGAPAVGPVGLDPGGLGEPELAGLVVILDAGKHLANQKKLCWETHLGNGIDR